MIKNRKYTLKELTVAFLLILSCMFIKPTFLGIHFTYIGLIICLLALLLFGRLNLKCIVEDKIIIIIVLTRMYFIFYQLITGSSEVINQFKALFSILIFYVIFSSIFTNDIIKSVFLKLFVSLMCLFTISYIITFVLSLFVGYDSLMFIKYEISQTDYELNIFFPFTPAHMNIRHIAGLSLIRLHCMFRESGIAQLFFFWLIALMPTIYFKKGITYKLKIILLILGSVFCMSATGMINLAVFVMFYALTMKTKNAILKVSIICLACVVAYFAVNVDGLKLSSINGLSYQSRVGNFQLMVGEWENNILFGVGYNSKYTFVTGLLQMLNRIGIVGVILYMMPFIYRFFNVSQKRLYLLSILPCIITILTSQPIIDAPILYILLLFYEPKKVFASKKVDSILFRNFNRKYILDGSEN